MAERVTIVIEPSAEHGGNLTVEDAMRQVLDFIEVVAAAASDDVRGKLKWKLLAASKNSPFTATAEAFSIDPDWPAIDQYARDAKSRVADAFASASDTGELPGWLIERGSEQFQRLFRRNLNGIGKTSYRFEEEAAPVVVVERRARATLERINQAESQRRAMQPDLSGEELGSIEGFVTEALTHYGRPAIRIRDRLTGDKVICILPQETADRVGRAHDWREVWQGQRVLVTGRVKRSVSGAVSVVTADDVTEIAPPKRTIAEVSGLDVTGGRAPRDYLDELWGEPRGED